MSPLIDERDRAVGEDLKEFAKLHVDLARSEVREGSARLAGGIVLIFVAAGIGLLAVLAATASLYLVLDGPLGPAGAAAAVTALFVLLCAAAIRFGLKLLSGAGSLLLPRTRAMLWELVTWRDDQTKS